MKTLLTIGALVVLAAVSYYYFTLRDEKRGAQVEEMVGGQFGHLRDVPLGGRVTG